MARKVFTVALNGVTGRMGCRQHLVRSLLAIRDHGGLPLDDGTLLYPEPVLVGRRELLELQVDGTHGSAVAGLRNCAVQHRVSTPMPVWNPDLPDPLDYLAMWSDLPDNQVVDDGFKAQWELFLRAAVQGEPFPCSPRSSDP